MVSDCLKIIGLEMGMVMDFSVFKVYLDFLVKNYFDYYYFNDSFGLESFISEAIVVWIFVKLEEVGVLGLYFVEVLEICIFVVCYFFFCLFLLL